MSELVLDVRLDGHATPIGKLKRKDSGDVAFSYTSAYLVDPNPTPLSLSLPLQEPDYGDIKSRTFFTNLLQERDQPLQEVKDRHGVESTDIVGLLFYLGADCAGAVSVLPEESPATKMPGNLDTDYEVVPQAAFEEIVRKLQRRQPLPNNLRDPSPLAGVQSKISILMLSSDKFALPKPGTGAPTTHVLKVPDRNNHAEPARERLSLQLSALCGVQTVQSVQLEIADIPVLVTERFDRAFNAQGQIIRLHQEDFAQALSLPPSLKYERRGVAGRRFDARAIGGLLRETSDIAFALQTMLRLTLFDLLVGNVDGHAKNHALLYGQVTKPDIAPRYDILPTRLDDNLTEELSYSLGNAKTFDEVDKQQLSAFLSDIGITRPVAQGRYIISALNDIVPILADQFHTLDSLRQSLFADLIAANMRALLPKLNFPVPKEAEKRDAFILRGGGWLTI